MARYQHLPLFQKTYAFSKEIFLLKSNLPKSLKHDLGGDLFASVLRCIKLIVFANGQKVRGKALTELGLEIQVQWVYLRLLHDLKAISAGQFRELSERLAEISPQVNAWKSWDDKQARGVK
jgi:hypothetical protein